MSLWRRCHGVALSALAALAVSADLVSSGSEDKVWDPPGIGVQPRHDPRMVKDLLLAGHGLFETRFNVRDGAGRPGATGDSKPTLRGAGLRFDFLRTSGPDANSCAGCHNQPLIGGSGDFAVNVFVGAQFRDPPTESIATETTSERNTIGLFGAGLIEMLAVEMTRELHAQREAALDKSKTRSGPVEVELRAKGVGFGSVVARPDGTYDTRGLEGIDHDLVVKPFGAKGVVISLREFTINALNQHHGIQAMERFGWERTGIKDFDGDGVEVEFGIGHVTALTLFQAALPPPARRSPRDAQEADRSARGERLFQLVGCTECHVPELRLETTEFVEPNPYNRPGNLSPRDSEGIIRFPLPATAGVRHAPDGGLLVTAFTDFKRHRICDAADPFFCNERLRQDNVPTDQFLTAKLWDVGTSSPYGHRGDCTTVSEAIRHHSAEARSSRDRFLDLPDEDSGAIVAFLLSLGVWDPASKGDRNVAQTPTVSEHLRFAPSGTPRDGTGPLQRLTRHLW